MALFIQHVPASTMTAHRQGGCCMARAISIVTGLEFDRVWQACAETNARTKPYQIVGSHASALAHCGSRNLDGGTILGPPFMKLMRDLGFRHTSLTQEPFKVTVENPAFQSGRVVVAIQDHAFAVISGVIHDAFDPQTLRSYQRHGIYHYWRFWG